MDFTEYLNKIQIFDGSDVPIEYIRTGNPEGETILFVHGLGMSVKFFLINIVDFMNDYDVICLSLRGHGNSGDPSVRKKNQFSFEKKARDIKLLLDFLGIKQVHYIGNSMGGMVGFELVKRFPEYVKTLTTFGTPPGLYFPVWLTAAVTKPFFWLITRFFKKQFAEASGDNLGQTPESRELMKQFLFESKSSGIYYSRLNAANYDYRDVIYNIDIQYLLIFCEKDSYMNRYIKPMLDLFKDKPNVTIKIMPHTGHSANLDDPDGFNMIVMEWLKGDK